MCDKSPKVTRQHSIAGTRLLLGCAGWPQPSWDHGYFPEDLPPDWRFAYYRNEADCLLMAADQWVVLAPAEREDWLDQLPEGFRFYVELNGDESPHELDLAALGDHLGALLVPAGSRATGLPDVPLWTPCGDGAWGAQDGEPRLLRWTLDSDDLRVWRQRVEELPSGVQALVFDGASANPRQLWEIRQLLQLLGLA